MAPETWAETLARVFEEMDERREFFTDADGYIYWWPVDSTRGHLSAVLLRAIADELDRRNKPWDDQVQAAFTPPAQESPS